jgi:hypothetical protein
MPCLSRQVATKSQRDRRQVLPTHEADRIVDPAVSQLHQYGLGDAAERRNGALP